MRLLRFNRRYEYWRVCDRLPILSEMLNLFNSLIAIMLGRLYMDIEQCIAAYKDISHRVFTPKRSKLSLLARGKDLWSLTGAFDSDALAAEIERIVEACGLPKDAKLLEKEAPCKV